MFALESGATMREDGLKQRHAQYAYGSPVFQLCPLHGKKHAVFYGRRSKPGLVEGNLSGICLKRIIHVNAKA